MMPFVRSLVPTPARAADNVSAIITAGLSITRHDDGDTASLNLFSAYTSNKGGVSAALVSLPGKASVACNTTVFHMYSLQCSMSSTAPQRQSLC